MNEKAAQPELGTFDHPKFLEESRPEGTFPVTIQYNDGSVVHTMASGVDVRDGVFLIARPRLSTRFIQGEWVRFWSNEVFRFVTVVEVVELTIERED